MTVQKRFHPRVVERVRDDLSAAEARWENEGGALEGEELSDPSRGAFSIDPVPPFRLDLSVWALRRRPGNTIDRWDGTSYRRALAHTAALVEVSVMRAGGPEAPKLDVSLAGRRIGRRAEEDARADVERMLGLPCHGLEGQGP